MAACPYCVVTKRTLFSGDYVGCTAKSNPGNANGNKVTNVGVSYAKCYDGKEVAGLTIKDCPFYKKGQQQREPMRNAPALLLYDILQICGF